MPEYKRDVTKDFIDEMVLLLMQHGMEASEARAEMYMRLKDIDLVPKCTDMVVYEGNVNDAILKRFIVAKKIKGCTMRTLDHYYRNIRMILTQMSKPVTQITSEDVQLFVASCMRRGLAKQTIDGYRLNLSSFFTWTQREGITNENPMNRVDKIKYNPRKETAFTDEEIERMRAVTKTWREKAIFELMLSTGCRVSEIAAITIDTINEDEIVVLGKGEKYRTVYLNAKAKLALEMYLAERDDGNPYLFPSCKYSAAGKVTLSGVWKHVHGEAKRDDLLNWYKERDFVDPDKPVSIHVLRQVVQRLAKRAGVENVHPHRFRRTCATHALQKGMPLELVSKMLGHNQLDTTKIYLSLTEESLKAAHRKYVS